MKKGSVLGLESLLDLLAFPGGQPALGAGLQQPLAHLHRPVIKKVHDFLRLAEYCV